MNTMRVDSRGNQLWKGEYERKDGRYEYRYVDRMGVQRSEYAVSLKQLRITEAKLAYREGLSILRDMKDVTLNAQFELWIAGKYNLRENTRQDYIYTYDTYVRNSLGKESVEEITTFDIKCHYVSLMKSRCISVETVAHIQNIVFQVLESAKESNLILNNPASHATKEFVRTHSKHISTKPGLSKQQAEHFLLFLKENELYKKWYPIFYVMTYSGLRLGEVTGLTWKDIDFKQQIIDVNHTLNYLNRKSGGGYYRINTPKTNAGFRQIPFGKEMTNVFQTIKDHQTKLGITCKREIDGYTDFVFLNRFGDVLSQAPLNRALTRAVTAYNAQAGSQCCCGDALLPHISCHCLRHTYANILCESGVNIKVMQRLLGHSDIQTTMSIYTNVTNDFLMQEYREKVVESGFLKYHNAAGFDINSK